MAGHYTGKRVTVMGLGTRGGGLGVARYLASQGAILTVTDMKPATDLEAPLRELRDLPVRFVLGRHDERDFTPDGADIVVRNPGVRRTNPFLSLARESGVQIEMEMTIFFRDCPAPIIGITGTKGKTTTSTLCAAMLAVWDERTVLAGNMGISALDALPAITPDTPVVLELSSWQVEALDEHRLSPRIAVLTNISEDHLDTYRDFAEYAAVKRSLGAHQRPDDWFVLNRDDPEVWQAATGASGQVVPFGTIRDGEGAWVDDGRIVLRLAGEERVVPLPPNPALAGRHQHANIAAAAAAAALRGAPGGAIGDGLHRFAGVRDRMEIVAEIGGVLFVNDTTATAPAATVAALERFAPQPIHLIAGGADKRSDLSPLVDAARRHAHVVYLLAGDATPNLAQRLSDAGVAVAGVFGSMEAALDAAEQAATAGEVVLLSPGCASFGLFRDEFDRGERFREAVLARERAARAGRR